ncbi:MAG TPA: hypothetical protein DCG57_02260, partial [Candidatus Riflebacteria bacterium]|nr:hypothetical protein [Candidatus Riflebacteria bacterium]
ARSRNLPVLAQYLSGGDDYALIMALAEKGLPDAELSQQLQEGHEACGPARFFAGMVFEEAQIIERTPFYLYDPRAQLYSLGGIAEENEILEALARRSDGFLACMRNDGRVIFVPEKQIQLNPRQKAPLKTDQKSFNGTYRYRKLSVNGALMHLAEANLKAHSFSTTVSPYYNLINPGKERTLFVDELARRASAKVAINGTFFNMDSGSDLYGWPVGSFFAADRLVHSLESPSLNALNRSYLAFTDAGRLIVGETTQKGTDILRQNQAGSFDTAKFGNQRIVAFGGGFGWLVKNGDPQAWKAYAGKQFDPSFYSRTSRRARSLVGIDASGRQIFFLAQEEGSGSPQPMSHPELAEYIAANTAYKDVVFLDGGGSTQLVIDGRSVSNPSNGGAYRKNSSALLLMP